MADRRELLAIAVGGALGAVAREQVADALPHAPGAWPWATLLVNLAGAFVLGLAATLLGERLPVSAYRRPLVGTGFCGALTTFSTVQVELLAMADAHAWASAAAYAAASVAGGLLAVVVGMKAARGLVLA